MAGQFALFMVTLCGLAILIGSAIAFQITRQLSRALGGEPNQAAQAVTRIASGDLSMAVRAQHPDSMLAAVSRMQDDLRHLFTDIAEAATDLFHKADQVAQASHNVRDASANQADASAASAASIEGMTTSINEVSQIAHQTEANSARTAELSEQGVKVLQQAAAEMARIANTVIESTTQIRNLQQRSQEIGGIGRYHAMPYLHDMGAALAAADLVISRAGASCLGEYPLFGLPAILVPYPYAWRYQKVNADYLTGRGAAIILEDQALKHELMQTLNVLWENPNKLKAMRAAMFELSHPRAADKIASKLIELAGA